MPEKRNQHSKIRLQPATTALCRCTKMACLKPWQAKGRSLSRPKTKLECKDQRCANATEIGRSNASIANDDVANDAVANDIDSNDDKPLAHLFIECLQQEEEIDEMKLFLEGIEDNWFC